MLHKISFNPLLLDLKHERKWMTNWAWSKSTPFFYFNFHPLFPVLCLHCSIQPLSALIPSSIYLSRLTFANWKCTFVKHMVYCIDPFQIWTWSQTGIKTINIAHFVYHTCIVVSKVDPHHKLGTCSIILGEVLIWRKWIWTAITEKWISSVLYLTFKKLLDSFDAPLNLMWTWMISVMSDP